MSNNEHEAETRSGQAVYRWLYGILGALVLILGGTYLYHRDGLGLFFGNHKPAEDTLQAGEKALEARQTFQEESKKLDAKNSVGELSIPTDADGFFAPPLEDEIPKKQNGDAVRRGREIFLNPGTNAWQYVGNSLACANCHLDAGRRPNAAPMWAAAVKYPTYRGKNKKINNMEDRIKGCFTYSMNATGGPAGGPPPEGDPIYRDLESYFHWLATGAPDGVKLPGAGYPKLDKPKKGYEPSRGKIVFEAKCVICHGENGQGRQDTTGRYAFPPLWGPGSYNWGAGMHRVNTAAGFIYANMPLGMPYSLTKQEAWDVAAFVNSHERPPDPRQKQGVSVEEIAKKYHKHKGYYGHKVNGQVVGEGVTADLRNIPPATGTVVPKD